MNRRSLILILAFFISTVPMASAVGAGPARKPLLRDGFVLAGVDGKLTRHDSNATPDIWLFRLDSDVNDGIVRVGAGTSLELLPSSTLEKMTTDAQRRTATTYKLWGRLTKYKGRNFIFPVYFLALGKTTKTALPKLQKPQQQAKEAQPKVLPKGAAPTKGVQKKSNSGKSGEKGHKPAVYDANDVLPVPPGIIKVLEGRQTSTVKRIKTELKKHTTAKPAERSPLWQDSVLADRTGFLHKQDKGLAVFAFDALGRNVQQRSLRLLPCEALERTERRQAAELEPMRLKIAGIVTKYKGKSYLLLERAVKVYSYENFDR